MAVSDKEIADYVRKFAVVAVYPKFQKYDAQEVYESFGWVAACEALAKKIKEIDEKNKYTNETDLLERYKQLERDYYAEAQECHRLRKEMLALQEKICSLQKVENIQL